MLYCHRVNKYTYNHLRHNIFKFLITVLISLIPAIVLAAPNISDVNGTVEDGETITIYGSDFGSTGPNVILFDNFERGTDGDSITLDATVGSWSEVIQGDPQYIDDGSGNIAWKAIGAVEGVKETAHKLRKTFSESDSVFLSYRTMIPSGYYFPAGNEPNSLDVHKGSCWKAAWFLHNSDSWGDSSLDVCCFTYIGSFRISGNSFPGDSSTNNGWFTIDNWYDPNATWNRYSSIFQYTGDRLNDPVWLWHQGVSKTKGQSMADSGLSSGYYSDTDEGIAVVNVPGWHTGSDYGETRVLYDDIYLAVGDNAVARVELGNSSKYQDCTQLAIITPTSWTETKIEAIVRKGTFSDNDDVYLFVVDSKNNVSKGYPHVFGEGDLSKMKPPSNLKIIKNK
jgi:hypothetical protein